MKAGLVSIRCLVLAATLVPKLSMAQDDENSTERSSAETATENPSASDSSATNETAAVSASRKQPPASKEPAGTAPIATNNAATNAPSPGTWTLADIGVQRVPASGYPGANVGGMFGDPAPRVRGIYGGSLWLTFHGLQWPYMPQQPGEPALMLGLSGSAWVDTSYEKIKAGNPNEQNKNQWLQQGRIVLRATPTYRSGKWFVQGQAELVANNDQQSIRRDAPDTDDLWVRVGYWDAFDVQVGRFQAWELYHLGMGFDLNTYERIGPRTDLGQPPDFYGATFLWDRPSGSSGNIAEHLYFTNWLRLEALTRIGNDGGINALGERGAIVLDFGFLKFKTGGEYLKQSNSLDGPKDHANSRGNASSLQFIFDPYVEFGLNAGYALVDTWDNAGARDQNNSITKYSYGGFANVRIIDDLIAGAGYNYTYVENLHKDANGNVGKFWQDQRFAALQYALFRQLFLKAVVAYDQAYIAPSFAGASPPFTNKMYSARLRASFYF